MRADSNSNSQDTRLNLDQNLDMDGAVGKDPSGPKIPGFFKLWFAFVAIVAMLLLGGSVAVVYLLLDHFGVLALGVLL